MDSEVLFGVGAFLALQVLQTIQIAVVGRKVSRTMIPPPMAAPPPQQYMHPFCVKCGALTQPTMLRDGLCPDCFGAGQTEPAPAEPPAALPPMRARRLWSPKR